MRKWYNFIVARATGWPHRSGTGSGEAESCPLVRNDKFHFPAAHPAIAQTALIGGLAALYGMKKEELSVLAMPLIARTVGTMAASSLLKLIPGLGTVAGACITGTIAATLTGAMGWFVQTQFEKIAIAKALGEPPPDVNFDFDLFKSYLDNYKKTH